jgi:hypothetical protein
MKDMKEQGEPAWKISWVTWMLCSSDKEKEQNPYFALNFLHEYGCEDLGPSGPDEQNKRKKRQIVEQRQDLLRY